MQAPQKLKPWNGVRSAKEFGSICYQYDVFTKTPPRGSEDCLYLNVYTPDLKPSKPLPVMFWIHGGAYLSGSGNDEMFGPEFLVRQDVILVTINYRLEVLGFLCLDTEEVPGNAGMKDQVAALKWVNNNIASFGGDPKNITIFGESVGAASVSYHLVSPMTKGLFKRAICHSGVATCWWGEVIEARERAIALAEQLGYDSKTDGTLYDFFKSQPKEALVKIKAPLTFSEDQRLGFELSLGIVSEKQFGDNERFFHGNIYDYLDIGIHEGVEVITGYTEDEGVILYIFAEHQKMLAQANSILTYFTPKHIALNSPVKQQIDVARKIKDFYMNENSSRADWEKLARFHSFETLKYDIIKWAKICASANKNKIYFFKFSCKSERNIACRLMKLEDVTGGKQVSCHVDDLFYIFDSRAAEAKVDMKSKTFRMIDNITKLWTNFAKYG